MSRTIVYLDAEATGLNPAIDRIVTLALVVDRPGVIAEPLQWKFNPGVEMSEEVIAIHGITNEEAAKCEPFSASAQVIHRRLSGCDLAGYNLLNFDVPLLWEEFYRCGIEWDLSGVSIIDVGNIFKKKEERTLAAAVEFYLADRHDGAHDALADAEATRRVLTAQLACYRDLAKLSREELAAFSRFEDRVDLAGKIVRDKDGEAVYAIGKAKGVRVKDDPSFAWWMMDRDFPTETKRVLARLLEEVAA